MSDGQTTDHRAETIRVLRHLIDRQDAVAAASMDNRYDSSAKLNGARKTVLGDRAPPEYHPSDTLAGAKGRESF